MRSVTRATVVLLLTAAVLAMTSVRISAPKDTKQAWTDVTPAQLAALPGRDLIPLVNVHIPYEGELPGTDAFIPYDQIGQRLTELPVGPSNPLILYCRTGRMSEEAVRTLAAEGYTNLYQLVGGFEAWERDGRDLFVDPVRRSPS